MFSLLLTIDNFSDQLVDSVNYLKKRDQTEKRVNILNWLFPHRYDTKHHILLNGQIKDCGTWFFDDPAFLTWRDDPEKPVLLCYGIRALSIFFADIAGAGKSYLMSLPIINVTNCKVNGN